ncbi:Cell division protein 50 [Spironucleus salmonicida]|uniref:Cell division protein 50 n=1 Tax=Spironucleus salmonicida TaxID=348837 RepID=V6LSF7_9EUKA|nr:Cell division protein 50 [Spironucleus salmonicida]|eukprot:EST47158.1 Cell division protein 50 [Spironucleus salmonicida]
MGIMAFDTKFSGMRFFQQNLQHAVPFVHSGVLIVTFSIISAFLLGLGSFLLTESNTILYEELLHQNSPTQKQQHLNLENLDPNKPLYIYYKVNDFHQCVRSYVLGYSWSQITHETSISDLKLNYNCLTAQSQADIVDYPCGIQYRTINKDSYSLKKSDGTTIDIQRTNITLPSDRETNLYFGPAFKSFDFQSQLNVAGITWEDVANWMRPSTFTNAIKLYGVITPAILQTLRDEQIIFYSIGEHKDSREVFSEQRSIIFSQIGIMAGKKETLQLSYYCWFVGFVTGVFSIVFSIILGMCGARGRKYKEIRSKYSLKI